MNDTIPSLCEQLVSEIVEASLDCVMRSSLDCFPAKRGNSCNPPTSAAPTNTNTKVDSFQPLPLNSSLTDAELGQEGRTKPQFRAKRPASSMLPNPNSKVARGECERASIKEMEEHLKAVTSSLKFVSGERDHWRAATEEARRTSERLAVENNRLAEESLELRNLSEEQGRACTLLAAELVEMVWSLTSDRSMETIHTSNLAKIAKQGLAQVTVATASKEEKKLSVGLLGCLVNITGEVEGLKVLLQTESGRELLKTTCHLIIDTSADSSLAELAMMLLVNLLSAEHGLGTADPKTTLGIDLMTKVGVAAGRWRVGERGRGRLVEVATSLEVALAGAGAAVKAPPQFQEEQEE